MVESSRETNGKIEYETRLYLTSLIMVASLMGQVVRGHWAIENSLHWVMDMVFRDDECRVRTDHAPANFTTIKHMAHNLLRTAGGKVNVKSLQMVMRCTDTQDGLVSPVAFWATTSPRAALRANRYTLDFATSAGDRDGQVRIVGQLRSNGKGTARITMTATSTDSTTGATIENCTGAPNFRLKRGPTS
jgi:hypothetical protein